MHQIDKLPDNSGFSLCVVSWPDTPSTPAVIAKLVGPISPWCPNSSNMGIIHPDVNLSRCENYGIENLHFYSKTFSLCFFFQYKENWRSKDS